MQMNVHKITDKSRHWKLLKKSEKENKRRGKKFQKDALRSKGGRGQINRKERKELWKDTEKGILIKINSF
jgi:hypothetical protein